MAIKPEDVLKFKFSNDELVRVANLESMIDEDLKENFKKGEWRFYEFPKSENLMVIEELLRKYKVAGWVVNTFKSDNTYYKIGLCSNYIGIWTD